MDSGLFAAAFVILICVVAPVIVVAWESFVYMNENRKRRDGS